MTENTNSSELNKEGAREYRTAGSRSAGLHFDTLFDDDSDQAGNPIDESTGERIKDHPNTTDDGIALSGLRITTAQQFEREQRAVGDPSDPRGDDVDSEHEKDVEKFLRENDPEHPLYGTDTDSDNN